MVTKRPFNHTLTIGVLAIIIVLLAELFGAFEILDLKASGAAFSLRGAITPSSNIVIVGIDDESFTQTSLHWPWPRSYFAQIVDALAKGKPQAIAMDVQFYEKFEGDEEFAAAIKRAGNVILANDISSVNDPGFHLEQLNQPVSILAQSAAGIGISNFVRDSDGFARSILAYQRHDGQPYFHWVIHAAARYLGAALPTNPTQTSMQLARQPIPLDRQLLLVNFRAPARTFRNIPAY